MLRRTQTWVYLLAMILASGNAHGVYADDLCSGAKGAAENYLNKYEDLRKLDKDLLVRLVDAVCKADDDERKAVYREAKDRLERAIQDETENDLAKLKANADDSLKAAIADDKCRDEKDALARLQDRVREISERIENLKKKIVGTSNPALLKLAELGQEAHKDYQQIHSEVENANHDYADAEVKVGDQKVDFLDSKRCKVVELKPQASSAVSRGWRYAQDARDWLNRPENLAQFIKDYPHYAECQKFTAQVDCYHYCPEINDEGELASTSIAWYTCEKE